MKTTKGAGLLVVAGFCLLSGCSKQLSRKEALRQITHSDRYNSKPLLGTEFGGPLRTDASTDKCAIFKTAEMRWAEHEGYLTEVGPQQVLTLTDKGKATLFPTSIEPSGECHHPKADWDVFDRSNPTVTGIAGNDSNASVEYQFEVTFKNGGADLFIDGPFYAAVQTETVISGMLNLEVPSYFKDELAPLPLEKENGHYYVRRTAQFIRYDNGWRIQPKESAKQ